MFEFQRTECISLSPFGETRERGREERGGSDNEQRKGRLGSTKSFFFVEKVKRFFFSDE